MSADIEESTEPQVARKLREDILTGRLQAGSRLTEAVLASRFGVGRGLVREAVQKLASQGLLISRPNRGAVVAPEAPREIRNLIIPIRRTVEVYALRLVFDELNEADFAAWGEILGRMRDACARRDFHAIAEADLAFHGQLLRRAGQPDLIVIWETLIGRVRSHFHETQKRSADPMEIHEEHRALLASFRGRDLAAAVRLLKEKIT
jgi:DNA-binding GntR family transcriptional regulator